MAKRDQPEVAIPFNIGDRVKIKYYDGGIARVVEYRGPLGPGGALVYRVRVGKKPTHAYIELLADQLQLVPAPRPAEAPPTDAEPDPG